MEDNKDLQTSFFKTLCKNKTPVSVYLLDGYRLLGTITSFDKESITLNNDEWYKLSKNTIAAIIPDSEPYKN